MNRWLLTGLICVLGAAPLIAEESSETAIRQRIVAYLDAFNCNDAEEVASYWSEDAVSRDDETGARAIGRESLLADFRTLFQETPGARLNGRIDHVRMVTPNVAIVEGIATLFTPGDEPIPSAFTAVVVHEAGEWVLESSHERNLPIPPSPRQALNELSWLIGEWRDQTEGVQVHTSVRWAANGSFLIRSFHVDYGDNDLFQGTQVIGWDPQSHEFRTWTFNSDGSFGQGTVSPNGGDWVIRMSHVQQNGESSTATQILTLVDDDTLQVQKIGGTLDGSPVPATAPITVVRVSDKQAASNAPARGGIQ